MERKEAIRSAYRLTGGNNFYDGMITCPMMPTTNRTTTKKMQRAVFGKEWEDEGQRITNRP